MEKAGVPVGNGNKVSKPDQKIGDDYLEAKMGPYADLSRNQRRLMKDQQDKGREFIIDAWQFRDVGKAAGLLAAPFGGVWATEEATPWRGR